MESEHFKDYRVIEELLADTVIPDMFPASQTFCREKLRDAAAETRRLLREKGLEGLVRPGMTVAVTAGSRGIDNISVILRETVGFLKELGAKPFIVPAMGSHGGATAGGQREILTGYGITEEFCGCPVVSSMETVRVGTVVDEGKELAVFIDRHAAGADGIVVVNRVKPPSAFRGPYESGLLKMLSIGLGKQVGADSMHQDGFKYFKTRIPLFGNFIRTHTNVMFGVAIVENAYDETNRIEVLRNEEIPVREPELLKYAFSLMPRLLVDEADVLVVQEIGKNFSGSGMDPNITGSWSTPYGSGGLKKQRTAILDLSELSHGNGAGMGHGDTITLKFFNKVDFLATYPNSLTATTTLPAKLPMVMRDDEMAIKGAIKVCNEVDPENLRVVLIKNTLSMEHIYLSKAYLRQIEQIPGIKAEGPAGPLPFDSDGNLTVWDR